MKLLIAVFQLSCLCCVPVLTSGSSIKDSEELCKGAFQEIKKVNSGTVNGKPVPKSSGFVGVGYHVLRTAIDPDVPGSGGPEAGLLPTRVIFEKTFNEGKTDLFQELTIADQLEYAPLQKCAASSSCVFDEESFEESRSKIIAVSDFEANIDVPFLKLAASASYDSKGEDKAEGLDKSVIYEDMEMCETESSRYVLSLAGPKKFPLNEAYANSLCMLPTEFNDETSSLFEYFLDHWGTHVTITVKAGFKRIDRSVTTEKEMMTFAMSNTEASLGAQGTISSQDGKILFDMEKASKNEDIKKHSTEQKDAVCYGNEEHPAILEVQSESISITLRPEFWQEESCMPLEDVPLKHAALTEALNYYPMMKDIRLHEADRMKTVPLRWPSGIYGFTKPNSGCPIAPDFKWAEGSRTHDTGNSNKVDPDSHFGGEQSNNVIESHFCMKTVETPTAFPWPNGKYCLYKKGNSCPPNFEEGWVYWDEYGNNNAVEGEVPEGTYGKNTNMSFCCRDDGFASNDLYLPTDKPFYLFPTTHACQAVSGMNYKMEYIQWDDDDWFNDNDRDGALPYMEGKHDNSNTKMYFCYYYPALGLENYKI